MLLETDRGRAPEAGWTREEFPPRRCRHGWLPHLSRRASSRADLHAGPPVWLCAPETSGIRDVGVGEVVARVRIRRAKLSRLHFTAMVTFAWLAAPPISISTVTALPGAMDAGTFALT